MDEKEIERRKSAVLNVLRSGIKSDVYNSNAADIERKKKALQPHKQIKTKEQKAK